MDFNTPLSAVSFSGEKQMFCCHHFFVVFLLNVDFITLSGHRDFLLGSSEKQNSGTNNTNTEFGGFM